MRAARAAALAPDGAPADTGGRAATAETKMHAATDTTMHAAAPHAATQNPAARS